MYSRHTHVSDKNLTSWQFANNSNFNENSEELYDYTSDYTL